MNFKNLNITTAQRNYMIIAGALILCIVVAAGAYFGLKKVAPRSDDLTVGQNTPEGQIAPTQIAQKADASFKAGADALKAGKTEEAIQQLNTAKKLYEEAGETDKAEQTADVISYAEHEAKVEAEQGQTQGQGNASPGGSGDLNGNGIIDNGEQAPPEVVTIAGDKATTERD